MQEQGPAVASNGVGEPQTSQTPAEGQARARPGASVVAFQRRVPTREDLQRESRSQSDLDTLQVQANQLEVLQGSACVGCLVLSLSCLICLMIPTALGLFIWLDVSYFQESGKDCDVPLRAWVAVVNAINLYRINCCGVSIHSTILKCCCGYDVQGIRPAPWPVHLYNILIALLTFAWHCIGLHWVRTSDTCEDTSPKLYLSATVFAAFCVVFNSVLFIYTVGIYTIFNFMLRNGMLHTDKAAPPGTLKQQAVVKFDPETFKDNEECSICLAAFNSQGEIRRTHCGHVFHSKCLGGWLNVNRGCPLCRTDLTLPATSQPPPERHGCDPSPA